MTEEQKQQASFAFLETTGIFYGPDPEDEDRFPWERTINLNDTWNWGCADCYEVPMEKMPELHRLYNAYGWCGVLYFVSENSESHKVEPEFHHYRRMIEFVHNEESIRKKHDNQSAYAYDKQTYVIGPPIEL